MACRSYSISDFACVGEKKNVGRVVSCRPSPLEGSRLRGGELLKWEGGVLLAKEGKSMSGLKILVFGTAVLGSVWGLGAVDARATVRIDNEQTSQANQNDDAAEIRRLLHEHATAIARMDIAGIARVTLTDNNYSTIEGGHANWGWANYRDRHLKPEFSSPNFRITGYDILRIHRIQVDRNLAFAVFRYEIRAEVKGRQVVRKKFATVVFARTPQGWKILHEHS